MVRTGHNQPLSIHILSELQASNIYLTTTHKFYNAPIGRGDQLLGTFHEL